MRALRLVPWAIHLIVLSRVPKAKRWFPNDPDTHRLSVLLFNDDEVKIEPERVADAVGLRERSRSKDIVKNKEMRSERIGM